MYPLISKYFFNRPLLYSSCLQCQKLSLLTNKSQKTFTYGRYISITSRSPFKRINVSKDQTLRKHVIQRREILVNSKRSIQHVIYRLYTQNNNVIQKRNHASTLLYLMSAAVLVAGFSYAAVPLYRIYCQATGYGGTTKKDNVADGKIGSLQRIDERQLTIRFEAGTNKKLQWKFRPQQKEVKLAPGETALAFYTAENLTDRPIIGIATYNVIPFDAGQYFNKIQCFCFEEQQLNPHEEVDMPVFFYIDPEFDEDPKMAKIDEIILSYTFFESTDAEGIVPILH